MTNNHTATITLSQTGLTGPIDFDLSHSSNPAENYPEGYMLAGMLAAKWFEIKSLLKVDENVDPNDTKYSATFAVSQEAEGGDLFFKLNMEPKLPHNAEEFPESFQAISHLATVAMFEVGVLDEDGNVADEEMLDNVSISATSTATLH